MKLAPQIGTICIRKLPRIVKLFLSSLPLPYLISGNARAWAIKNKNEEIFYLPFGASLRRVPLYGQVVVFLVHRTTECMLNGVKRHQNILNVVMVYIREVFSHHFFLMCILIM